MTPLIGAVKSGSLDCVKILLDNGADYKMIYKNGNTVLHIAALLKKFEILKYIYTNYKMDYFIRNEDNDTAYEIATLKGDESMQ